MSKYRDKGKKKDDNQKKLKEKERKVLKSKYQQKNIKFIQ